MKIKNHNKDYREKKVQGLVTNGIRFMPTEIIVRMTSDRVGKSLSLQAQNIMIEIALEDVKDIIRITPKEQKDGK